MDVELRRVLASQQNDQEKMQFANNVAARAFDRQLSQDVHKMLEVATTLILEGKTPVDISAGFIVYSNWAKAASPATLESFFNQVHLLELLESSHPNTDQVPSIIFLTFQLMQRGPHLNRLLATVGTRAIDFVKTHRNPDCMLQFLRLLLVRPDVVPIGDLPCLCQEVLLWMGRMEGTGSPADYPSLVQPLIEVAKGLESFWHKSSAALNQSLQTIFEFLLQEGPAPSCYLALAVAHIPIRCVETNVAAVAVASNRIGDHQMTRALERLLDWLNWPTPMVSFWVLNFFDCLAQAKRTSVLFAVSESRAMEVLERMKMQNVSEHCLKVLSEMLLGYQHSPKLFHQMLGAMPAVWECLKTQGLRDSLAILLHTLMYMHPGHPELYAPVQDLIKGYKKPTEEEMQTLQGKGCWAVGSSLGRGLQLAELTPVGEEEPQPLQAPRKGLMNSGTSCYANCVVQSLLCNDRFRRLLMLGNLLGEIADRTREMFSFLIASERPSLTLDGYRELFKETYPLEYQQDCHEFMDDVLNRLNDGDKAMRGKQQQESPEPPADSSSAGDSTPTESVEGMTELEKIFWIKLQEKKECQSCRHQTSRQTFHTFLGLPLEDGAASPQCSLPGGQEGARPQPMETESGGSGEPVPQASHAPPHHKQPREIRDLVNAYFEGHRCVTECLKCGGKDVLSYESITRPPDSLKLTLYRFEYKKETNSTVKKLDVVNFQRHLLLPVESGASRTDPQDPHAEVLERLRAPDENGICHEVYGLTGVVVHQGAASTGHYYVFLRHAVRRKDCHLGGGEYDFFKNDWIHFDDERVDSVKGSRVMQGLGEFPDATPYLFIYTRVGSELLKDCDASAVVPISQFDPPMLAGLLEAVTRDNAILQQELRKAAVRRQKKKEQPPGHPWKDSDSDQGPPGNCGGGQGFGGFNSGPHFVF